MMKIAKSLAIIAIAVVAVAGGTYAWTLQTEAVSDTTYTAGSMDLKIDENPASGTAVWVDGFSTGGAFNQNNLKPGSFGEQIIDIRSVGDTNATASVRLALTSNRENSLLNPEIAVGDNAAGDGNWNGELAQNMRVKISYDSGNNGSWVEKYDYTLAEYNANTSQLTLGAITSGTEIASVKFQWSIPESASNNIMTDSAGINIIFGLE